jgi:Ca2+-binding EF-hand superfamily protein
MLVALQKCDQETIDDLRAIFRSLDMNGNGLLEKDDLVDLTRTTTWQDIQMSAQLATAEESSKKHYEYTPDG